MMRRMLSHVLLTLVLQGTYHFTEQRLADSATSEDRHTTSTTVASRATDSFQPVQKIGRTITSLPHTLP